MWSTARNAAAVWQGHDDGPAVTVTIEDTVLQELGATVTHWHGTKQNKNFMSS
jgi:hypothetical protein